MGSSCHAKKTKHFSNVFANPRLGSLGSPSHTTRFLVAIPDNCQFSLYPIQLASPLLSRYEATVGESEGQEPMSKERWASRWTRLNLPYPGASPPSSLSHTARVHLAPGLASY